MYSGSNGTFDDEYIRYVLDTYSVTIIRLCFSYVRNIHDAEDIAQDVFCGLITHRPVFESSEHEKAWLLRTAVNKCKNHLKSSWVSRTVLSDDDLSAATQQTGGSPEDDNGRELLEAVMSLPEKYRTVIHLYYYNGLSLAEIAAAKHISTATAGTQLARGRELLRKKLGEDFRYD